MTTVILSIRRGQRNRTFIICLVLLSISTFIAWLPSTVSAAPKSTATTEIATATTTTTTTAVKPTNTPYFIFPPSPTPPATSGNSTLDAASCPPPMVPNIHGFVSRSCMGPCCLPCPASAVFYEPHKLENVYTITSIFRGISASACALLSICYLLLPNRRRHPHLIVLLFALLMVPWEGLGTAWLYKKEDLLCKNVYEIANMTNSWLCGLQGIALQYIVLVMLCLGFLLIANLHFLSVYRSSLIHNSMSMLMVFSFILPLSLVVPVAVRKQIENPGFGSICFVSSDAASAFFFYPLSVVVCLATLLHLGTIAFMIRTSLQANKNSASHSVSAVSDGNNPSAAPRKRLQTARDISLLLKQQWRPGLFAVCLLIIDMIYWLFYFIESKKLLDVKPTTQWFADWIACLGQQAKISFQSGLLSATSTPDQIKTAGETAQRICASVAEQNVPNFAWAALTDLLPAMFGIMILIIFGSRLELWQDLRKKLFGSRGSSRVAGGTGGNSGSGGSKIMMQDVHSREPKKMERPRRDYSTTYRVEDGLHDEDLQQDDNPYGSRTNLALSPSVNAIGSKNGSGTKMTGTNRIGDHRLDTPEPWKPIAWPPSVTGKQQDDMYDPTFRSASPQLRINTNTNRSYQKPQQQSSSGMARAMSPISPSRQNGFYNFEEIDAAPVSLTTPPPTYSHGSPLKPGSPSSRVFAPGNRPISPHRATEATGAGGDQVVVAEASRVRLNYRISSDARQFMTSPQPRLQQQQSQQQQGQRQQTFDPMEPSTRAMSPSPTVPQKSRARPMKNGV